MPFACVEYTLPFLLRAPHAAANKFSAHEYRTLVGTSCSTGHGCGVSAAIGSPARRSSGPADSWCGGHSQEILRIQTPPGCRTGESNRHLLIALQSSSPRNCAATLPFGKDPP